MNQHNVLKLQQIKGLQEIYCGYNIRYEILSLQIAPNPLVGFLTEGHQNLFHRVKISEIKDSTLKVSEVCQKKRKD